MKSAIFKRTNVPMRKPVIVTTKTIIIAKEELKGVKRAKLRLTRSGIVTKTGNIRPISRTRLIE